MQALWIHRSMEHLQNLIVRRACNNSVPRQEVITSWMAIQREVDVAILQMDKEYAIKLDAISLEEKARDKSVLGGNRRW